MSVTTANIILKIRGIIKDLLTSDGRDAFEYDTKNSFQLSQNYVASTGMAVYLNGNELDTDDWSYNSTTNKVTISPITSGVNLVKGDNIIITFSYYKKYSDTELSSYIKSNLMRFTQRRYPKLFYMNSSSQIVAYNGQSPSEAEGDIIALVTAIDIDPQNVNIKIGNDFNITATENKPKSEQINDVIDMFTRSLGVIKFLEDET